MTVITYQIELLEPCLVTSLQGDPNSGVAFDYLPGTVLRGALVDRYLRRKRQEDKAYQIDAAAEDIRTLFFNGRTGYLNGYPLGDNKRSLPAPLAWHVVKGKEAGDIYDFAVEDASEFHPASEWKGFKGQFIIVDDDQVFPLETQRHIAIHIARDRHPNRDQAREPRREVYRYDALAPGQWFAAAILCPDESTAALTELLPEIVALGGSRSGGYGRVKIHNVQTANEWRELPGDMPDPVDHLLTVTLLSDALIRDRDGHLVASDTAVTETLAAKLNCPLTLTRAYYQTTLIGGFNRKWGLPLPQAVALKMGSVFIFQAPDCPNDQLQALEMEGIGERRLDGFGRLAINWHREAELAQQQLPVPTLTAVTIPPKTKAAAIAQDVAGRLLRQKLDAALDEKGHAFGRSVRGMKKSQLHALRQVVHSALLQKPDTGRETLDNYLQHALKRRVSREQLEKTRVEGQKLADWLARRFTDETEIWQKKYLAVDPLPQIGGISAALTPELVYEYNLRLVAAVLSRAAQVQEQGGRDE